MFHQSFARILRSWWKMIHVLGVFGLKKLHIRKLCCVERSQSFHKRVEIIGRLILWSSDLNRAVALSRQKCSDKRKLFCHGWEFQSVVASAMSPTHESWSKDTFKIYSVEETPLLSRSSDLCQKKGGNYRSIFCAFFYWTRRLCVPSHELISKK